MKAIMIDRHIRADELKLRETATPEIASGTQVRVRLKAAGVNPLDTKLRGGAYPLQQFPLILGCDGAGVIDAVGDEVSAFKPGDAVYFFHGGIEGINGNYAEYAVLDERFLAPKPQGIDFIHAAAAPVVLLTAWEALHDRLRLQAGQTLFINAGAGGVGHVAIQLAKHIGARVLTTVSSDEKAEFARALGADKVINYREQDVEQAVLLWTAGQGVDAALDSIGGRQTETLFPLVKYGGDLVSLLLPHQELDWREARTRNQRFSLELMLTSLLQGRADLQRRQTLILRQCRALIDRRRVAIKVSRTLPLKDAATAHAEIEAGHTLGKIVLEID